MKKRLLSIVMSALTLLGTIRAAAATGSVTTTTTQTVEIDGIKVPIPTQNTTTVVNGTTVPNSTTVTPSVTAPTATTKPSTNGIIPPDVGKTVGTAAQGIVTTTVTTAGTGAIQSGERSLTTTATQQTAEISTTLNKIPFVGGMANGLMKEKIAAGIGDLSKIANTKFMEMIG